MRISSPEEAYTRALTADPGGRDGIATRTLPTIESVPPTRVNDSGPHSAFFAPGPLGLT